VSTGDNLSFLVIVFIPAAVLATLGAFLGEVVRDAADRRHRHPRS
jgi:hypothetical protein